MSFQFRRSEYAGIAIGAASGSLVFGALPFVVGAAISTFGNPASAGIAASVELIAMGVSSTAASAWLQKLPGRNAVLLSAIALCAGHVLSALAISQHLWTLFLVARLIAGIGEGALYTVCTAFAAKAGNPDRAFTIVAFGQTIFNALFFTAMALANVDYDPQRTFTLFVIFGAVSILPLLLFPKYTAADDFKGDAASPKMPLSRHSKVVLVTFSVFSIALYMLFPYVEDIGVKAGFSHSQVAQILAVSTVAALAGPVILASIGSRFGRLAPIMVGIACQMVAAITLVYSRHELVWGGAELTSIVMLYVLNPLMFGLAAHVDRTGRLCAMATAIMAITAAIGPAISSLVLALQSSYVLLGWFNAAAYVVMVLLLAGPIRIAERKALLVKSAG